MADRRTINSSTGIKKVFTTIAISPAVSWRLAACADARSRSETTFRRSSSNSFEAESRNRPPTSCHMCHICHIPTQASANRNFEPFEPLPQLSSTARQASGGLARISSAWLRAPPRPHAQTPAIDTRKLNASGSSFLAMLVAELLSLPLLLLLSRLWW